MVNLQVFLSVFFKNFKIIYVYIPAVTIITVIQKKIGCFLFRILNERFFKKRLYFYMI